MATILVVDDDANIREVVGLYLRRGGYAVISAADGEEALELYRRRHPDLVVLDLMLPKLSGLKVCRRLGAERRVPLIMLTARGEEENRILGLDLGADDYVVPPGGGADTSRRRRRGGAAGAAPDTPGRARTLRGRVGPAPGCRPRL